MADLFDWAAAAVSKGWKWVVDNPDKTFLLAGAAVATAIGGGSGGSGKGGSGSGATNGLMSNPYITPSPGKPATATTPATVAGVDSPIFQPYDGGPADPWMNTIRNLMRDPI